MIKKANRLNRFGEYYFSKKLREVAQLKKNGLDIINLGIGSPDLAPPKEAIDTLRHKATEAGAHQYQSYQGIPELREAIAKWYARHFKVCLNPENEILPLIGSKEGIFHLSMAYLDKDDVVLVPDPGYPAYTNCAKLAGATILPYDLKAENDWLPDLEELEKNLPKKAKMMWVNYPHMPTGASATEAFFAELIEFGLRNNILICHDNPYCFILNDKPISILNHPKAKQIAVELTSLSKSYNMAGWRVGMLSGAPEYLSAARQVSSNIGSGMFRPIQLAATAVLDTDQSWFDKLNVQYLERKAIVLELLQAMDCQIAPNQSGMFVWAKAPEHIEDIENWLDGILHNTGVFITPGFIFGRNGSRYVRVSLCNKKELIQSALTRIKQECSVRT